MSIDNERIEKISFLVISVLYSRFISFPGSDDTTRNAPFHEAFLNAFSDQLSDKIRDIPYFISLNSWLHGLNTTIGQAFFEKAAHVLSNGEKREYTSKRCGNLKISQNQKENINTIITNLSNTKQKPELKKENHTIFTIDSTDDVNALDFSADVFFIDDDKVVAIELKSVRPNSGEMRGEKHKILEGKAALFREFPDKEINYYIGFPFDPTSVTPYGSNKERFMNSIINANKFFDPDEVLLGVELWDLLSGTEKTMETLVNIINQISKPDFMDKYNFLMNSKNRNHKEYMNILKGWNMFSEIQLIQNDSYIRKIISNDNQLKRVYNRQIFKDGKYDDERLSLLKNL